uniref:Secreted protein n=1 Tax=Arundo donax TaxID=35708 RepID=A0A0A9DR67_ARUDO
MWVAALAACTITWAMATVETSLCLRVNSRLAGPKPFVIFSYIPSCFPSIHSTSKKRERERERTCF